ncbi:TIGR01906 family membrane protein [Hutsoniella sourekii]
MITKQVKQAGHLVVFILTSLSVAVILTTLVSPWLYHLFIKGLSLDQVAGLPAGQLMANYRYMVHYLLDPFQQVFELPDFASSPAGKQHFVEVKHLFQLNGLLSLALIWLTVWLNQRIKKGRYRKTYLPFFQFAVVLPLLLIFVMVLAFDQIFIAFHQLFFRNDLWLFDPLLDPIITVLPQSFFLVLFIVVILFYELVLLFIRWLFYRK